MAVLFDKKMKNTLMCKRTKQPYMGMYNLVGGKIEKENDGLNEAYRELEEEIGQKCGRIEPLLKFHSAFAYCDEYIEIFYATDFQPTKQHLDEDEYLEVQKYDLDDLLSRIFSGEISDSKTIAAILAYKEKYVNNKK